jgi:hypothetical protein
MAVILLSWVMTAIDPTSPLRGCYTCRYMIQQLPGRLIQQLVTIIGGPQEGLVERAAQAAAQLDPRGMR